MTDRIRVYELAREIRCSCIDVISALHEVGHDVTSHSSVIDLATVAKVVKYLNKNWPDDDTTTDGDNKPSDDNDGPPGSRVPKRPLPKSPDVGMQKALANDKTNQ